MTYREAYERGVRLLSEHGIEEAGTDARLLLEHVCHTDYQALYTQGERAMDELQEQFYVNYLQKRSERIPLQYLTHNQSFMGLDFYVNESTLIPRLDTEILVEEVMRYMQDGMAILDLCTGSGCILLSLLHYSNGCFGVGTDLSKEALAVAVGNARTLGLEEKMKQGELLFLQGDLYDALNDASHDVSNGVLNDASHDVSNEVLNDASHDVSNEVLNDASQGVAAEGLDGTSRGALDGGLHGTLHGTSGGGLSGTSHDAPGGGLNGTSHGTSGGGLSGTSHDASGGGLNGISQGAPDGGLSGTLHGAPNAGFDSAPEGAARLKVPAFDVIVSNPPYIRSKVIPTLMPEVKEHEPLSALDGGDDGLRFYRRIIDGAAAYVKRESALFFEIGADQGAAVSALLLQAGYRDVRIVKDYAGLDRVVYGVRLAG